MLDAAVPATFEDVGKARKIGVDIRLRLGERVPYSGLRGKVDDLLKTLRLKQTLNSLAVCKVDPQKAKMRIAGQPGEPGVLQIQIVIAAEIVDPNNLIVLRGSLKEPAAKMKSDEPRTTGDQDLRHKYARATEASV